MNPDVSTFIEYPKTPRLFKDIVVTEKIDGTNAQVVVWKPNTATITVNGEDVTAEEPQPDHVPWLASHNGMFIAAGSRNRWLTPEADNFGFARWVKDNAEQLTHLGPGRHYGEWWGSGIQRGYGQPSGVRHFSLFNVGRWDEDMHNESERVRLEREYEIAARKGNAIEFRKCPAARRFVPPPACCSVVPVLYVGPFNMSAVSQCLRDLRVDGSAVSGAEGFMNPEGIVVYHTGAGQVFKAFCNPED